MNGTEGDNVNPWFQMGKIIQGMKIHIEDLNLLWKDILASSITQFISLKSRLTPISYALFRHCLHKKFVFLKKGNDF